ncbi:hypothetical protein [Providencia sp. PROV112]|nr:hypothetical protein [Providencia sp. PROV112]
MKMVHLALRGVANNTRHISRCGGVAITWLLGSHTFVCSPSYHFEY